MFCKQKPRKKSEALPPSALKILKRIKLEEKKRSRILTLVIPEEEKKSDEAYTGVQLNNEGEEEEEEVVMEKLEALVESEQDRLVEEILRKRRQFQNRSSFMWNDAEVEEDPDGETTKAWESRRSIKGSEGSGNSISSGNPTSQGSQVIPQPRASINTIIKERILYHGLNKYADTYDRTKYWPAIPKPKKRAKVSLQEADVDTPVSDPVPTSTSDLSVGTSSGENSNMVFDHRSRFKSVHAPETPQQEAPETKKKVTKSRQSVVSAVSKIVVEQEEVGSDESIVEQLVSLDARKKKKTTKERIVPYKTIPGYPKCIDETTGFPECLPPGEIVRKSIRADQLWGIPVNKPLSKEQLIDLLQKLENYPTNDYVYLSFVHRPKTPAFHPYLFKVMNFKDVDPKEYFTLSKSGIMHFQNGMAEYTTTIKFIKQIHIFERLRKIPFLMFFPMYKSFRIWRSNIWQTKMKKNRKQLDEALFITKRPMRGMLSLLFRMIEKISEMGLLSLHTSSIYQVKDFAESQGARLEIILKRFQAFEKMVLDLTENACRTYLVECGFSADNYAGEMEFYLREMSVPVDRLADEVANFMDYPGQWLPYSLQAKKKRICGRLSNFIHLVDFYVQAAYHRLLKNSVLQLMCELHTRTKVIPKYLMGPPKYLSKYSLNRKRNEALLGKITTGGGLGPIFEIGCSYNDEILTFTPTQEEFIKHIRSIFFTWKNGICEYKNLLPDDTFNPYTRPIVNGYMDEKTCGDGPSSEMHYNTDPDLSEVHDTIEMIMNFGFDACRKYVNSLDYVRLFCVENDKFDISTLGEIEDVEELMKILEKHHKQLKQVNDIQGEMNIGIFHVNNDIFRQNAFPSIMRIIDYLNDHVPRVGRKLLHALIARIDTAIAKMQKYPETADDYVDYLLFLDEIQEQMDDIEKELDDCCEVADVMEIYKISTTEEDMAGFAGLFPLLSKLRNEIDDKVENREILIAELVQQFQLFNQKLSLDMEGIRARIEAPDVLDPNSDPATMAIALEDCKDLLTNYVDRAAKFNKYQRQLKLEVTNYDALDQLIFQVRLRHQLWDSMHNWDVQKDVWEHASFSALNDEDMTKEVVKYVKSIHQLEKGLPANEVVPILKAKVESMKIQISLISHLHNPNLQQRHWDVLEKTMNMNMTEADVTLKGLNEAGIENFTEFIQEVSAQASSEFSLEALLKKVEDAWKEVEFVVIPHKDKRNVFILGGTDDIQVLLDDSNLHMATIASSRHVGPIKPKVDEWTRLLDLFSRTLDEWLNCQRNWIYLESIFSAPDIQRQLPAEAKMFGQVDKSWGEIMQKTNKMPAALRAATTPGLLDQLLLNNELLDQIMKCLDDYLESKRVIFPRFYFLSNEELLEILAQTRNPQAVQPHLRKCFDAIQKLEFGGPANAIALDVLAMFSPEDERVKLTRGLKARGNVEEWLGKVEDAMTLSLKQIMRYALQEYHVQAREEWLQKFPSQCVLTISQLMWAQKVHEILDAPGNKIHGMKDFENKNFENLTKLATMVRGQLHSLVRAVLCALITIDVHARDIITGMVHKKVTSSTDFEWLKQLRYYWEPKDELVVAKMANSQYYYGYEYLGASPRLVVTPLTDRCYLCLMGALQLDLGGAPAGPAGTGKTETTKDLAKALAFMCVVFNCSEGLDYKMMGRFFSGLAQSGGWCCFDEFNRIDIEVLSVIAQQLITIRLAKVQRLARFLFEGREIRLIRTCSAFITMNPGYAGRTELPDNLKALFRPISMMVPDYTLIAEVILYSEGFESSKSLANKMTQMYKLCSEQLSQQDHYDFGMRAVKSVLVMAGSLKRSNPTINENVVLIRALRDSNLPKFLAHDAVLLQGIIQDLFPGVEIPEQDFGVLQTEAVKMCLKQGLQAPDYFILKVIQLFETMVVRHGVMLVGKTGGGKTTCYGILKAALTSLYQSKVDDPHFRNVDTYVLNPKAVSMGELYGEVNPLTLEWRDGLLGIMVRTAVKPKMTYHQWVICDGPVDAIWIENMNTVLDDNKMLCLANSERIKLTNWVRMLFEVQDLAQASPATVSRCGMLYVDNSNAGMGWRPYVQTFLETKLPKTRPDLQPYLEKLFFTYVDEGFVFVQKNCQELIPQANLGKISMLCSILEAIFLKKDVDFTLEGPKFLQLVCQIFVFAYLWAIGGNISENNYAAFSNFVRGQFETEEFSKLPKTRDLWSYYNNVEAKRMETWETILPSYVYDPKMPFVDILVPTVDTVRFGYLMELLLSVDRACLFTGLTGTGKSAIAKYVLSTISGKNNYVPNFINFSAQTTSQRTQEMIEGKLEKRRKAQLSAPFGKKVICFVDDLNMPRLDRYGAQPALELLRQILDFNGCYDRIKNFWKELQNVLFSAACAPPGGGRNAITPRLLRHFCMMAIPTPTTAVLKQIYQAIVKGYFEEFDPEIREMSESVVNAAIETYQFMTVQYRPTIAKAHYVFNMRDLSKCIQGVLQANRSAVVKRPHLVRLFYHECQRVFHDRLTDEQDKTIFCNSLAEFCTKTLREPITSEGMKGLIYGDFMKMRVQRENRVYDEIVNKEKLIHILHDYLEEYNITTSKEMHLVFFVDAADHISRIARILRTDRGNALLVGVGGTGKQSLTKLGCWISSYKCFQIELMRGYDYSSFHDDLKKLYEVAGMKNDRIVFLFTDTQIAYEEFLEDINNILNSGEVPNLLEPEDLERMIAPCRAEAKKMGIADDDKDRIYDYFIRRIRSNLHVVLCMSPIGDSFRIRCRMFPSLVNCCTIDWYCPWPTEALFSVAQSFMTKIDLGPTVSADSMAHLAVYVHESVSDMADVYYEEMRRKFYTTPSSYLELINLYTTMLAESREKIQQGKLRIQNGLQKLLETNVLVKEMRIQLKELEPILVQKSQAVETVMQRLAKEQAAADLVRTNVQMEEAAAKEKAIETQLVAEEAQRDLAEVMPALEAAVKALEALEKADITEVGAYKKPPKGVQTVMETVCILFKKTPDWNQARLLLSDTNFIKKMMEFDKNSVNDEILNKLKPYLEDKDFVPEKVVKISKALKSLCMWVHAMAIYGKVYKMVEPKRQRYLAAQAELDRLMELLRIKQAQLMEVERQIALLQKIFQKTLDEKRELEETMELTAARLHRAGQLTSALASEQARWLEAIKKFGEDLVNIIGDVFVGAACIAYFGVFTSHYRLILVNSWVGRCIELTIPVTPTFTLSSLADPFEVRVWNSAGLPRDITSTENGVLATRGRRWPLMIDPQDQANRWIKQMESARNLRVLKMTDSTYMRTLENCLRLGIPALLEEVGESLDPSLEPILLRQIFTQTGRKMIRLGDTNVDYDDGFRLYMTTKLANPHYLPEVCIKVTIINCTVTLSGLEDQLLGDVVSIERPDLESQRVALLSQINSDKNQLVALESKILRLLYQSEGNILDDVELIQALNDSKATSAIITKRLAETEITEKKISLSRESYRPAASRGSVLYFVVAQLAELDPMYQYSLKYFTQVFNNCIASVPKVDNLEQRLHDLREATTLATYTNISRGLFEKDKLIFSFMLCTDVLRSRGLISDEEWGFFLRGGGIAVEKLRTAKPLKLEGINAQQWNNLCDLENTFKCFSRLVEYSSRLSLIIQLGSFRKTLFNHQDASEHFGKSLTSFQIVLLIKSVAEEKLVECITEFVRWELGQSFIESPVIDLNVVYNDLNKMTPLIFVLSVGSDPMAGFYKFASDHDYRDRVQSISLGQGQGPVAETMIRLATLSGDWVFLQNCHLASSWMLSLEKIVKRIGELPEVVHESFRLYLSSMPSPTFPVSVLQESVKITNEPPKGLRANVRRALVEMEKSTFESHVLRYNWSRMNFGICLFHAIIQERKKFGPLGWNIKYEFNDSDRECCLLNLNMFCKDGHIPWDALEYITGQITYGGRITDGWDQRCLTTILKGFFSEKTLKKDYKYSESGIYYAPVTRSLDEFLQYADKLPMLDEPEIFGMDTNANIIFQKQESNSLMTAILTAQPRQSGKGGAQSSDDIIMELATGFENSLPPKIEIEKGNPKLFKTDAEGRQQSQSVFLQQEVERFNKLLGVMRSTLDQLKKGVKGLVVMSEDLERMYFAFLNNQVPDNWTKVSYGSLKCLSSWYKDFLLRVGFINSWLLQPTPLSSFWLSGFFFPQGFLTSVLQTFARTYKLPIDQLKFLYNFTQTVKEQKESLDRMVESTLRIPTDGVLVHGLFVEAARWVMSEMSLGNEKPGETVSMLPVIHFLPAQNPPPPQKTYTCPLYKTSIRAGTLSTTGHSTNFIVPINIPSKMPEDYWILRGTALLTQLTD